MVGTKSHGYSNSGQLSEGEYSGLFFSTHPSPISNTHFKIKIVIYFQFGTNLYQFLQEKNWINKHGQLRLLTIHSDSPVDLILTIGKFKYTRIVTKVIIEHWNVETDVNKGGKVNRQTSWAEFSYVEFFLK